MTSRPSQKRRRRLTIAALILLVLCGGLWWLMRPQIDPRLVGTWISDVGSPGFFGLRFHADGRQEEAETLTNSRPNWTSVWKWSISGKVITVREYAGPTRNFTRRIKWMLIKLWDKLSGNERQFEIVELTKRRLTLRPIGLRHGRRAHEFERYTRVIDGDDDAWNRFNMFPKEVEGATEAASAAPP